MRRVDNERSTAVLSIDPEEGSVLGMLEQQAVRRTEYLNVIGGNPKFMEILGDSGTRELLREVGETIDLDEMGKIFPEIDEIDGLKTEIQKILAQQQEAQAGPSPSLGGGSNRHSPLPSPKALDYAGNVQSGQDQRLIGQGAVGQM